MTVSAFIVDDPNIRLWNLTSQSRYQRILSRMGVGNFLNNLNELPSDHSLLIIRGDYLFDARIFSFLMKQTNVVLEVTFQGGFRPVVAHVDSSLASATCEGIQREHTREVANLRSVTLQDLSTSFSNEL